MKSDLYVPFLSLFHWGVTSGSEEWSNLTKLILLGGTAGLNPRLVCPKSYSAFLTTVLFSLDTMIVVS